VEFLETPLFTKIIDEILSDEDLRELQAFLINRPDAGDVIPGTGGVRKVRWSAQGKGKRGGARIIYYFVRQRDCIYLLFAYTKNVQVDLSHKQKKEVAQLIQDLLKEQL
jgi:hypothetical protein